MMAGMPGIQAIYNALKDQHAVTLAGSATGQSGSSAAINTDTVFVTKQVAGDDPQYSVATGPLPDSEGAEPATAGLIAASLAGSPDILISGINAGANIGSATQISGTVGATVVGISNSFGAAVPAIAISTDELCDAEEIEDEGGTQEEIQACLDLNAQHYANIASWLSAFIDHLESKPGILKSEPGLLPHGVALNINYPPTDNPKGVMISAQDQQFQAFGLPFPISIQFGCYADCGNAPVGVPIVAGITGILPDGTEATKNGDTANFAEGYITIVPVQADYTAQGYQRYKSVVNGFSY